MTFIDYFLCNFKMLTSRMIETKILEELDDLHYSLTSRENEVNYLRQLADLLIASYVDESRVAGFSKNSDVPRLHSSLVSSFSGLYSGTKETTVKVLLISAC